MSQGLVFMVIELARAQVSHHIYSITDLMATDSLGGGQGNDLYTITLAPPPEFLVSRAVSRGPRMTSTSQHQRAFLPTPLPSVRPASESPHKPSKIVKSKKGEDLREVEKLLDKGR